MPRIDRSINYKKKPNEIEGTPLEKTMLYLSIVVTIAAGLSIGIQIIALQTPTQIFEGQLIEVIFIISMISVYKLIFGVWIWQPVRK